MKAFSGTRKLETSTIKDIACMSILATVLFEFKLAAIIFKDYFTSLEYFGPSRILKIRFKDYPFLIQVSKHRQNYGQWPRQKDETR